MLPRNFFTILIVGATRMGSSAAETDVGDFTSNAQAVLAFNFPDPALIQVDNNWYAFSTSGNDRNIQVAASPSFVTPEWKLLGEVDALPDPGPWAANDRNVWAPDVIELVSQSTQMLEDTNANHKGGWQVRHVLCSNLATASGGEDNALHRRCDFQ